MRVLLIEDDGPLARALSTFMVARGFVCERAESLAQARAFLPVARWGAVLLDWQLPDGEGLSLLPELRRRLPDSPVIILTARDQITDRIQGLDAGADDYLPKPFSMAELAVRVEALLRRVSLERHRPALTEAAGGLVLDEASQGASYRHQDLGLTGTEFRLLQVLLEHRDQVLSKPFLYQAVLYRGWGRHDRSLDLHVSHLRRKLRAAGVSESTVRTVWGQGYTLVTAHL